MSATATHPEAGSAGDPTPASRPRRLLRALGEALRGAPRDYTVGSIPKALLLLAVPMVIEMSMESLFALVDIYWVSKLGRDAVAIVGKTESMLSTLYALAMGLSMATAATVARRIGEKDRDGAATAAVQGVAVGIAVSLPIAVAGALFASELLAWMETSDATIASCGGYTTVMFGGNATILLLFVMNAIFRGAGDGAIAMRVLLLANGINLVLDPCLIFGWGPFPELGVEGAAIATNIGRGVGVLYQLWNLARPGRQFQVERRHVRIVPSVLAAITRFSLTGVFQSLIQTTSWLGLVRVLATFGEAAVAGYTIGIRVVIFGLLPAWGLASAGAAMVGQSLGAKDPARAEKAVWLAGLWNFVVLGAIGLFFILGAPWIVRFFVEGSEAARADAAVAGQAVDCLRIISYGFVFFAFGMVLSQAFNGAGDPWTPTWINLGCFWAFEVPLAWWLAKHTALGPAGVYWAIFAGFSLFTVVAAVLFKRGKWKTRQV